ncbi:MAG: sodium:calcium antiporter, partial [Flavobacteriales bacterium]|nr:sodium:calcium antiporter [Flavobacteriales bacterium]
GNLVGSNIFNILFIIGTSATITPIEASLDTFRTDLIMMTAIALLLYPMMRFGDRVGRWQGVGLLALYVGYMVL